MKPQNITSSVRSLLKITSFRCEGTAASQLLLSIAHYTAQGKLYRSSVKEVYDTNSN